LIPILEKFQRALKTQVRPVLVSLQRLRERFSRKQSHSWPDG